MKSETTLKAMKIMKQSRTVPHSEPQKVASVVYGQKIYIKNITLYKEGSYLWGRGYAGSYSGLLITKSTSPTSPRKSNPSLPYSPKKDYTTFRTKPPCPSSLEQKCSSNTCCPNNTSPSETTMVPTHSLRNADSRVPEGRVLSLLLLILSPPNLLVERQRHCH
jgi:hypothetical protein